MRKGIIRMATGFGHSEQLIPLKRAAFSLGLTPEGLRQRLLNLDGGFQRSRGRWFIEAQLVEKMLAAAVILGRPKRARDKKEPRPPYDEIAGNAGQVASLDDVCGVAGSSVKSNGRKARKLAQKQAELAVYDGRDHLGMITIAADRTARAFDRQGKVLGTFESIEAASAAFATESKSGRRS